LNDLIIGNINTALANTKPEYGVMLKNIDAKMPAVIHDTSNFHKSHSQFMQVTLDVTSITPIRSIYHILAEVHQTRMALQEAYIKVRKKQVELKRKEAQLLETVNIFDREILEIEILEFGSHLQDAQDSINGAIRKMNFLVNQHDNILKKLDKTKITEADYEQEEAKYHVMTCMKQALNAARSRNGIIDEGNMIYLFDLGINGAQAQAEVFGYLQAEANLMAEGKAPTHEATMQWLEACAEKYCKDAEVFAKRRGFSVLDETSLTNFQLEHKE
jgi:hypothetical protein